MVVVREDKQGDKRLVAYLVAQSETTSNRELAETQLISQLKEYLQERLPNYMVPNGYVVLPQLPLTPNGKVDRKALPAPDLTSSLSTEFVAPETTTQKALAEIWAEVLGIKQVGIHDNFFELGGHSLMATQVVSRIRQVFGMEFPLSKLFESSTVESLSKYIDTSIWAAQTPPTTQIKTTSKRAQGVL